MNSDPVFAKKVTVFGSLFNKRFNKLFRPSLEFYEIYKEHNKIFFKALLFYKYPKYQIIFLI